MHSKYIMCDYIQLRFLKFILLAVTMPLYNELGKYSRGFWDFILF